VLRGALALVVGLLALAWPGPLSLSRRAPLVRDQLIVGRV